MQDETIAKHDEYIHQIIPIIYRHSQSFIVDPVQSLTYDQVYLDSIMQEALLPDGNRRYFVQTIAETSQTPVVMDQLNRLLQPGAVVVYGDFQPVMRNEAPDQIVKGWRQFVFPQAGIRTISYEPDDELQQAIDICSITHAIESLQRLGIADHQILIRMNDHWGILGRLLERLGLGIMQIRELRFMFDELTKKSLESQDTMNLKETLIARLRSYVQEGRMPENIFDFFVEVVRNNIYNSNLLQNDDDEIVRKISRLKANGEILKSLYEKTGIVFAIAPTIFVNEKASSFAVAVDIQIDATNVYREVANVGGNMSFYRQEGYYLSGFAMGILRVATILKNHGIHPRQDVPNITLDRIKRAVGDYRRGVAVADMTQVVPFQQMFPGFTNRWIGTDTFQITLGSNENENGKRGGSADMVPGSEGTDAVGPAAALDQDDPGAWFKDLRYVLEQAHRIETEGLLGVPLAGLVVAMWILGSPTLITTALLGSVLMGLGPLFQVLHYVANPEAASNKTVRRVTYWTMLFGLAVPFAAQSAIGVVVLAVTIAWLVRDHRLRNQRWVMQVVADAATTTNPIDGQLQPFLARVQDRGLTVPNVELDSWRALARQVNLDISDELLDQMVTRFVDLYNTVCGQGIVANRELAEIEMTTGITNGLMLATAGAYHGHIPTHTTALSPTNGFSERLRLQRYLNQGS